MKRGPKPNPEIAARNRSWADRFLAGEAPADIAASAGKSETLVWKALRDLGVKREPGSVLRKPRAPASYEPQRLSPDERVASQARRRAYMQAYVAERRLRAEVRRKERASLAGYAERNREARREQARRADPPLTPEEKTAREAERRAARGEDALQAMLLQAATFKDVE